jgi:hypothetical protein
MSSIFDIKANIPKGTPPATLTSNEQLGNYFFMTLKLSFMLVVATTNFLALSISLNCNKFESGGTRFAAAIYAFLFGFVYIVVNYYTYRVMTLGKICQFDEDRIFPF